METFIIIRSVFSTTARKRKYETIWVAECSRTTAMKKFNEFKNDEKDAGFILSIKVADYNCGD